MADGRVARGRRTREAIIDAAIAVLREHGSAAVTHRAVAKRAGTSLAATTYHFATLDDLLVQAFELLTERNLAELERHAEAVLSGRMDLIDSAMDYAETINPEQDFGSDGVLELIYCAIRNERLRKPTQHLVEQMSGPFADLIGEDLAGTLVRALNGLVLHHQALGHNPASLEELRADLTRLFATFGLTEAVATRLEEES